MIESARGRTDVDLALLNQGETLQNHMVRFRWTEAPMSFIEGPSRAEVSLLPPCIDDYVPANALVRIVDAFVDSLDLSELGFHRTVAAATGRPGFRPGDQLRLYIWGYLNQVRSSRMLERSCVRDLEALWLLRRLAPDYRTIAAFRHDNPEAIVRTSAAFIQFCREQGLVGGRMVALDGTKIRAVASPKNIAGAERLARDIAHTEGEIAYYLDRLDVMDEQVAKGFDDQPALRSLRFDAARCWPGAMRPPLHTTWPWPRFRPPRPRNGRLAICSTDWMRP